MIGESSLFTSMGLNITRRITFLTCRYFGKAPREAAEIADDVAISAGSVIGTAAAIVMLDPLGGALSVGYLVLEQSDAEKRAAMAARVGG